MATISTNNLRAIFLI